MPRHKPQPPRPFSLSAVCQTTLELLARNRIRRQVHQRGTFPEIATTADLLAWDRHKRECSLVNLLLGISRQQMEGDFRLLVPLLDEVSRELLHRLQGKTLLETELAVPVGVESHEAFFDGTDLRVVLAWMEVRGRQTTGDLWTETREGYVISEDLLTVEPRALILRFDIPTTARSFR